MHCRIKTCHATFVFALQPRSGFWKPNEYLEHASECFGQVVPAPGASPTNRRINHNEACAPAYTAQQVARFILEEAFNDPNINSKTIAALVRSKGIYRRQPPYMHYRAIRKELLRHLSISRAGNTASLEGYAHLLKECAHHMELNIMTGLDMKSKRIKAATHISRQCQKAKSLPKEATFQEEMMDISDINDDSRCFGFFVSHVHRGAHLSHWSCNNHCLCSAPRRGGATKLRNHI